MKSPSRSETGVTATESSDSLATIDGGEPEDDTQELLLSDTDLMAQAEALVMEECLLAAARLLEQVKNPSLFLQSHLDLLKQAAAFQVAIEDLLGPPPLTLTLPLPSDDDDRQNSNGSDSEWTKQSGNTAMDIYYKVDDEARLTCRIDSPMEASLLVPLLSVLNEVNLFTTWLPSWNFPTKIGVQRSHQLQQKTKCDQTLQITMNVPWPMAVREVVMQAVAVDDIDANGWIAVRMEQVETDIEQGGVVPPPASGVERIDFAGAFLFRACPADHPVLQQQQQQQQQQEQPSLVLVSFKMFVDAHVAGVPMSLINFVTRTVIGHMWAMLLQVAREVRDGKRPQHAAVIAAKPDFYRWVDQRVQVMLEQQMQEQDQMHEQMQEDQEKSESVSVALDQPELDFVSYLQG